MEEKEYITDIEIKNGSQPSVIESLKKKKAKLHEVRIDFLHQQHGSE